MMFYCRPRKTLSSSFRLQHDGTSDCTEWYWTRFKSDHYTTSIRMAPDQLSIYSSDRCGSRQLFHQKVPMSIDTTPCEIEIVSVITERYKHTTLCRRLTELEIAAVVPTLSRIEHPQCQTRDVGSVDLHFGDGRFADSGEVVRTATPSSTVSSIASKLCTRAETCAGAESSEGSRVACVVVTGKCFERIERMRCID